MSMKNTVISTKTNDTTAALFFPHAQTNDDHIDDFEKCQYAGSQKQTQCTANVA